MEQPSLLELFGRGSTYTPRIRPDSLAEQWKLDFFLEVESLNSVHSKLSEMSLPWFEIFHQHAQDAAIKDAAGNYLEAEALYHLCEAHLKQAAEELEGIDTSITIALSWIYLALANLYRSSNLWDPWKATECLISLLCITRSNPAASTSNSKRLDEIRLAISLTVLEWADALEDNQSKSEGLQVALEEACDVVEEWKVLGDLEVQCFLIEKLRQGYAKLGREARSRDAMKRMASRQEHWTNRLSQLMISEMQIDDEFLNGLLSVCSSTPFQNLPPEMQMKTRICVEKFREFGTKAKVAANAGHFLEAVDRYQQCADAVVEAGTGLPTSRRGILLQWVYEKLGHIYRFDIADLEKAGEYFGACLLVLLATNMFARGPGGIEAVNYNISSMRKALVEIMFERACDIANIEERENSVALAILEVRKEFPEMHDCSDLELRSSWCYRLSKRYEDVGRLGDALKWTEERLRVMSKKDPFYDHVRLHSAKLLQELGDYDRSSKILAELKNKFTRNLDSTSTDIKLKAIGTLPYVSNMYRRIQLLRGAEVELGSGRPKMTQTIIEEEQNEEEVMTEMFLTIDSPPGLEKTLAGAKDVTKLNIMLHNGGKSRSKGDLMEAIHYFNQCLELISKLDHEDIPLIIICHGNLSDCHKGLMLQSRRRILSQLLARGVSPVDFQEETKHLNLHFQKATKHSNLALRQAEKIRDIYSMAVYNKQLGDLYLTYWRLSGQQLSDEDYQYVDQGISYFRDAGRSLSNFLYIQRDPSPLWISVQEHHNSAVSVYYDIQRSIYDMFEFLLRRDILARKDDVDKISWYKFVGTASIWRTIALIWAERGHSRSLAFKLTERNMGSKSRLELKKFDVGDWQEAWKSILESRSASGPGTVMIEYIQAEGPGEKFFIYALFHKEDYVVDMQLQKRLPEEDLEALLTKLNNHMSQKFECDIHGKVIKSYKLPDLEVLSILEKLYEAFITPVQQLLDTMEDHHKLVICANKILAGVPFAALRNPVTKKFLIERHTLICTPSLRILKQCHYRLKYLQEQPLMPEQGAALVLGNPAFEDSSPALEFSGNEADSIANILGSQNVLLLKGKDALKDRVLNWVQMASSSGKYQALMHLGTHGHGKEDDIKFKEGALEFADKRVKVWPRPRTSELNIGTSNLSKSQNESLPEKLDSEESSSPASTSLRLQEPEQQRVYQVGRGGPLRSKVDPLYLTAEEIVKDYEWRILLVVLSACETARGEVKTEGTLNLARALLISGVPCTVVSQWRVEDASTSTLMAELYSSMVVGMDVASALRASMVRMIHKNYDVHQWAPFVVMGLGTVTLPDEYLSRLKPGA